MPRFRLQLVIALLSLVLSGVYSCSEGGLLSLRNLTREREGKELTQDTFLSELGASWKHFNIKGFHLYVPSNFFLQGDFPVRAIGMVNNRGAELEIHISHDLSSPFIAYITSDEGLEAEEIGFECSGEDASASFGVLIRGIDGSPSALYLSRIGRIGAPSSKLHIKFTSCRHPKASYGPILFGNYRSLFSTRTVSKPFEGSSNQVTDLSASVSNSRVSFEWTERNTGDCNNDGLVGISDIFPLADHFFHKKDLVSGQFPHPIDYVIDGDGSGKIDIGDIFPIAENFFSAISGYDVFLLPLSSLDQEVTAEDFISVEPIPNPKLPSASRPTVTRSSFYVDGEPPQAPIVYSFSVELANGFYAVAIRSFSRAEDNYANVPFSNIVKFQVGEVPVNHPPQWLNPSEPGILSISPEAFGATATFGDAYDVDGDEVIYRIFYSQGDTVDPDLPQVSYLDVARSELVSQGQVPPFTYLVSSLEPGYLYAFMVRIYDEWGLEETPPNNKVLTVAPVDEANNPYPWPYFRKDHGRTGVAASTLREPLVEVWSQPLSTTGSYNEASPVLDESSVIIGSVDGRLYAFNQQNGETVNGFPYSLGDSIVRSTPALYGSFIVQGVYNSYAVLRRTETTVEKVFDIPLASASRIMSSPVVYKGIIYAGSNEGDLYAFTLNGFALWQPADLGQSKILSDPSVAGNYVFVATEEGYVYKVDITEAGRIVAKSSDLGTIRFSSAVPYPPESPSYVLIGVDSTQDGRKGVFRLDASDLGNPVLLETRYAVRSTPLVVEGASGPFVVIGDVPSVPSDARIYWFDLASGSKLRETSPVLNVGGVLSSPVATSERIIVGTTSGYLYLFDYEGNLMVPDGINVGGPIYSTPAIRDDWLFVTAHRAGKMELIAFQSQP